jgi:hypothetical protein
MMVRLTTLPDEPRGGAWPSPVRAVRCPVNSGNGRDPRPLLPSAERRWALRGDRPRKGEEGAGYGRSVCPESPGPHATFNGGDSGMPPRKGEPIPKLRLSWNRGLQLALVNAESLVTARYHRAVNTSPLLAHTAHRSTRAGNGREPLELGGPSPGLVRGEKL